MVGSVEDKRCPYCGAQVAADALFCPRDGKPLNADAARASSIAADPFVGMTLEGQILIEQPIGSGTMGRVYRAFQSGVERDVAVKILRAELTRDAEAVTRFHREAEIASRLTHPNVVQVLMSGSLPVAHDGEQPSLYLVMEHLSGISLLSAFAAAGAGPGERALPLGRSLHIMLQVCDAVAEAHALGIIHRDIKPENVMLINRGSVRDYVKVLDFGMARLLDGRATLTDAGLIFGSAAYISPEGAMGERVGPAADVYTISTVLYECLAGRVPFTSESPVKLLLDHAQEPAPELLDIERASYVPKPIADVIMANLAKDPADRAADAGQLADQLIEAAKRCGIELEPPSHRGDVASGPAIRLAPKIPTKDLAVAVARARQEHADEQAPVSPQRSEPPPADDSSPSGDPPPPDDSEETHPPASDDLQATDLPQPDDGPPSSAPRSSLPSISGFRAGPRPASLLLVAVVALALLVVGYLFGRNTGKEDEGALARAMAETRQLASKRHWSAPPKRNVEALLAQIERRWPAEPRARLLRREMAERLLADGLRLKYAGRVSEARQRVRLALELNPQLDVASKLLGELDKRSRKGADEAPVDGGKAP